MFQRYWKNSSHPGLVWEKLPDGLCSDDAPPLDAVAASARWLAGATRRQAEHNSRFLVIGGDHSCAIGTWSGVSAAIGRSEPLGLIWIDAHMDMHVPATTHSGAINGMPVAVLLGCGAPELTGLIRDRRAISPDHICLVGVRSFEPEEREFARRHRVRVIDMDEVSRRGIGDALAEARVIAGNGVAGYGVSLDLDAFDPEDAPGVGTPEPDGVRANEFLEYWTDLTHDAACRGVEIVEYNPYRDQAERTAKLMSVLVDGLVREERKSWIG